jgi:hypothetical protein
MSLTRRRFFELIGGAIAAIKAGPLIALAPEAAIPKTVGMQMKPRQQFMSEAVPYMPGNRYMYVRFSETLEIPSLLPGMFVYWDKPNVVTSCPKDWFDPKTAGLCVGQAQRGNYGWIMIAGVGRHAWLKSGAEPPEKCSKCRRRHWSGPTVSRKPRASKASEKPQKEK